MEDVKLLGFWSSPYVHRVIWALKLKGISYEYLEQDRFNKSDLLLQSNPVYKKVPVLIHGGKAIAESPVILEYIEETWPDIPLLPKDTYDRAVARFWIKFADDVVKSVTAPVFQVFEDEQGKANTIQKALETLKVLEDQGLGDKNFFGGNSIGLVDISYGVLGIWLEGLEEIVGIKLMEANKLPRLQAWLHRFKQVPVIKDNLPNYEKLKIHLQWRREGAISGSLKS
uniref:Glutathione S-transferase n=1 Tax=Neltuma juliflora TaxID=3128859 RepID=B1Q1N7_NELJU|nr:auxin-induced glutathione S transferase [Prosopis juliflora]ACD74943.1 auxin-induced glutathione S-transferase [Prosopis juliflora]